MGIIHWTTPLNKKVQQNLSLHHHHHQQQQHHHRMTAMRSSILSRWLGIFSSLPSHPLIFVHTLTTTPTPTRLLSSTSRRAAFFKNPTHKSGYKGAGTALPKSRSSPDSAHTDLNNLTTEAYESALGSTLMNLCKGVEGMKGDNSGLVVTFVEAEKVVVCVDSREFVVRRGGEKRLVFESPVTGVRAYGFDEAKRRWVSEEDGHDFEGLFVRDLMRHAFGVPTFVW